MELEEAYQPYTISQITAQIIGGWRPGRGNWRPGLGQPLYTKQSGTYWGVEHPAAVNTVKEGELRSSYLVGRMLKAGQSYVTHHAVMGVSDKPEFVKDAFFDYIDKTRVRPLRLQTQYNSWFDYKNAVSADKMTKSIKRVSDELNAKRGVPPLKAYVIDDGWENVNDDWSKKAWTVNPKFDPEFQRSFAAVKAAKSNLGLWLSPGCNFGARTAIHKLKAAGHRSLDPWMSMSHPLYMQKLEERMVELTEQGVSYYKLDGIFGHLVKRNFDIEGFKGSEKELNKSKYDDQKIQYLTDGADRLIQIFQAMHKVNPDVYIVISNGAWLSPWWLQSVDAVWMINAGDASGGSDRTGELVYRDGVYHGLVAKDNTQFPLHSIFNHEPKKTTSKESKEAFRSYLYMNMSRGTSLVELYIKPFVLKDYDWDVLAEGLLWAHDIFPTFKRIKMHGGNPGKKEVYGYTAWLSERGYVSIHNPSLIEKEYTITLDREFGLHPDSSNRSYHLSSPIASCTDDLKASYSYGEVISLKLKPKEVRILNFDSEKRDWSQLKELQVRTKEDYVELVKSKLIPVKDHLILGVWQYGDHTREFKEDGTCVLSGSEGVVWTKPFIVVSSEEVTVDGLFKHVIQKDGSLNIEGKYRATKL